MIQTALVSLLIASNTAVITPEFPNTVSAQLQSRYKQAQNEIASKSMSLDLRYGYELPENVYKDNILLNMAYISGQVNSKDDIDWNELKKPFTYEFSLEPGQRFAYHKAVLKEYSDNLSLAPDTNFGAGDGYKYEGGLYGMGVCHLASLIHWVAKDAGLESIAPSNHDFYPIPEIPKEYGVAIFNSPDAVSSSVRQNLYIKNNLDAKVIFRFDFDGVNLKVIILR